MIRASYKFLAPAGPIRVKCAPCSVWIQVDAPGVWIGYLGKVGRLLSLHPGWITTVHLCGRELGWWCSTCRMPVEQPAQPPRYYTRNMSAYGWRQRRAKRRCPQCKKPLGQIVLG